MAANSKRGLNASKSRSSGMKGGKASVKRSRPTAAKGKPGIQLPGEKAVRATGKTVGVKPLKLTREARTPLDSKAIDRRRQLLEDPKRRP